MNTTLMIKTDARLRDEAREIAKELGVPLTTIVNSLLKQFVREKKFSVSVEPSPSDQKIKLWEELSKEMDSHTSTMKSFSSSKELLSYLKLA